MYAEIAVNRRVTSTFHYHIPASLSGRIAPGLRADINVIDYARLRLKAPTVAYDLPAGGKRLLQGAEGYEATIVAGAITYRNGEPTGALPGRLLRGGKAAPQAIAAE